MRIIRYIFQGDSLSQLLFVLVVIPMLMVQREVKAGFQFGDLWRKVEHLLFMDDL